MTRKKIICNSIQYKSLKAFCEETKLDYERTRKYLQRGGTPEEALVRDNMESLAAFCNKYGIDYNYAYYLQKKGLSLQQILDKFQREKAKKPAKAPYGKKVAIARICGVSKKRIWRLTSNGLPIEEAVKRSRAVKYATPIKVGEIEATSLREFCRETGMSLQQLQRDLKSGRIVNELAVREDSST